LQVGRHVDASTLLPQFDQLVGMHQPFVDAIRCIRAEGVKTALLTNNFFTSPGVSFCPVDRSLFDVVS